MNRWAIIGTIVPAATLASIVALVTGDNRGISLQIWLGCFIIGFAVAVVNQLRARVPAVSLAQRSVLKPEVGPPPDAVSRARRWRMLEGLVLNSRDHERAFTHRLQPHLIVLATHYLRINRGIDIEQQPDAAAQVFGDVGWMLDTTSEGRRPTLAELDIFIQLLEAPSHAGEAA